MEWKWVKSLLIVIFLVLNCFLGYQVYQRNTVVTISDTYAESIKSILASQNIKCNFNLMEIEAKKYMKKINISSDKNIDGKFMPISLIQTSETRYSGRNRRILSLSAIIVTFIRDSKLKDVNIDNIVLGYCSELDQIDKKVLSGEAIPAWLITLESGEEYIYNAYLGTRILQKTTDSSSVV